MSTRELSILTPCVPTREAAGDGVEDGGVGVLVGLWGDVVHYVVLQDIQVVAKRIKFVFQRDCYAIYNLLNHFSTSFSFA